MASEHGIDPQNAEAVRLFDRKRPTKRSNEEWVKPHDPDAKLGRTKAGATDMIYQPEQTVDLDTGAIVPAAVRLGHEADAKDSSLHVLQAQANINQAQSAAVDTLTVQSATGAKGYHAVGERKQLPAEGIRTVISDPVKNRKLEKLGKAEAQVVRKAKWSAGSKLGKALLRRRGMHLERSFVHILDAGGARRTTLRGLGNLNKRFPVSAAIYNLSQLIPDSEVELPQRTQGAQREGCRAGPPEINLAWFGTHQTRCSAVRFFAFFAANFGFRDERGEVFRAHFMRPLQPKPRGRRSEPGATPQVTAQRRTLGAEGATQHARRNGTDVWMAWRSLSWAGPSAIGWFGGRFPRALPRAGMRRAVGAGGGEFGDQGGEEVYGGGAGGGELRF